MRRDATVLERLLSEESPQAGRKSALETEAEHGGVGQRVGPEGHELIDRGGDEPGIIGFLRDESAKDEGEGDGGAAGDAGPAVDEQGLRRESIAKREDALQMPDLRGFAVTRVVGVAKLDAMDLARAEQSRAGLLGATDADYIPIMRPRVQDARAIGLRAHKEIPTHGFNEHGRILQMRGGLASPETAKGNVAWDEMRRAAGARGSRFLQPEAPCGA